MQNPLSKTARKTAPTAPRLFLALLLGAGEVRPHAEFFARGQSSRQKWLILALDMMVMGFLASRNQVR